MLEIMTLSAVTPAPAAPSPDWWGALNGLHPIVIHFPIALVITAAIVEFIAMLARKERPTQFTVISLVVAALAGAVASWSGWGLADEGYGGGWSLTLHRWLGVGTSGLIILLAILALVAWYGAKAWATASVRAGILVAAGLVAATAHFGGDMVWGGSLVIDALFPEQPATSPRRSPSGASRSASPLRRSDRRTALPRPEDGSAATYRQHLINEVRLAKDVDEKHKRVWHAYCRAHHEKICKPRCSKWGCNCGARDPARVSDAILANYLALLDAVHAEYRLLFAK